MYEFLRVLGTVVALSLVCTGIGTILIDITVETDGNESHPPRSASMLIASQEKVEEEQETLNSTIRDCEDFAAVSVMYALGALSSKNDPCTARTFDISLDTYQDACTKRGLERHSGECHDILMEGILMGDSDIHPDFARPTGCGE